MFTLEAKSFSMRSECLFLKRKKKWVPSILTLERVNINQVQLSVEIIESKKKNRRFEFDMINFVGFTAVPGVHCPSNRAGLCLIFKTCSITVAFGCAEMCSAWSNYITRTYGNGQGFLVDIETLEKGIWSRKSSSSRSRKGNYILFIKGLSLALLSWHSRKVITSVDLPNIPAVTCVEGSVSILLPTGLTLCLRCPDIDRFYMALASIRREHNLPLQLHRYVERVCCGQSQAKPPSLFENVFSPLLKQSQQSTIPETPTKTYISLLPDNCDLHNTVFHSVQPTPPSSRPPTSSPLILSPSHHDSIEPKNISIAQTLYFTPVNNRFN